jgi:glycosyltransferase involved in cell wall biosynthesis
MPVITTGAGGIKEMVFNDKNGLVIPKSVNSLIAGVNELSEHPEIIIKMGKESRRIFEEKFTIERTVLQLNQVIAKIL